jgi:hypothetical protein
LKSSAGIKLHRPKQHVAELRPADASPSGGGTIGDFGRSLGLLGD